MSPFRSIGLLAAVAAAVLAVLFLRGFSRWVAYPGSRMPLPRLAALGAPARLVSVPTAGGLVLQGAFYSADPPGAPAVLYFHGNGESAAQNAELALDLARRGISTFLAEYRGYGGMPGRPDEKGLVEDAGAAYAALTSLGVQPGRVVVVGRSLGTGPAVDVALATPPGLLVLVAPYTSFTDLGRGMVGPLAPLLVADRFDTLARIGGVSCPVVILHGTRDEVVPFRMGRRLAEEAARTGRAVRFVPLEGVGHFVHIEQPRTVADLVLEFLS